MVVQWFWGHLTEQTFSWYVEFLDKTLFRIQTDKPTDIPSPVSMKHDPAHHRREIATAVDEAISNNTNYNISIATNRVSKKNGTLVFGKFLGFLGVYKFHLGHFSTALSAKTLKISTFLLFGEKLTEILAKQYGEVILKLNIFLFIFEPSTWALISPTEHS